jgi:hypothetical protein
MLVYFLNSKGREGDGVPEIIEERKVIHDGRVNVDTEKHPIFDYTTRNA